jgi:hypothetical protein
MLKGQEPNYKYGSSIVSEAKGSNLRGGGRDGDVKKLMR